MNLFDVISENQLYIYGMALGFALFVVLLVMAIHFAWKRYKDSTARDRMLNDIIEETTYDELGVTPTTKIGLVQRWNEFWGARLKQAGWARYNKDNAEAGRDVLFAGLILGILAGTLSMNIGIGIVTPVVVLFLTSWWIQSKVEKKEGVINDQLASFLFTLKANLQATDVLENAFVKVIDSTPNPLRADLETARLQLQAGAKFRDAIVNLQEKTSSRDLKFLCACMIQASASGANLEDQLETIQEAVDNRRKVANMISESEKKLKTPTMVSIFTLPIMFVVIYFISPGAREFWFVSPISWILFLVAAAMYAFGVFWVRKLIRKVKNL